jgi:hypothetical protein
MPSKTCLIVRRPQGGRLEGRTIVMQPAFSISSQAPSPGATIHGQLMAGPRGVNLSKLRQLDGGKTG